MVLDMPYQERTNRKPAHQAVIDIAKDFGLAVHLDKYPATFRWATTAGRHCAAITLQ